MKQGYQRRATIMPTLKSNLSINLDNPDGVFNAGEVIKGTVELDLKQVLKVKWIKLMIYGSARVSWDERRSYTKGSAPVVSHKNAEELVNHVKILLMKDKSDASSMEDNEDEEEECRNLKCFPHLDTTDEGVLISPGQHKYPFSYTLPQSLPSTYDGKWGQIKYIIKASLERPWKFPVERDMEFSVMGVVDLNDDLEVMRPIGSINEYSVGILCLFAGNVVLEMKVGRRGYVMGDDIPIHVEIENNSGRKMRQSRIALLQQIIFRAGEKMKKITNVMSEVFKGEIEPRDKQIFTNEILEIPRNITPSTQHCKAVQIRYQVALTVSPSGWEEDLSLHVNVIIGTVSFKKSSIQRFLGQFGMLQGSTPSLARMSQGNMSTSNLLSIPGVAVRRSSIVQLMDLQASSRRGSATPTDSPVSQGRSNSLTVPGNPISPGSPSIGRRRASVLIGGKPVAIVMRADDKSPMKTETVLVRIPEDSNTRKEDGKTYAVLRVRRVSCGSDKQSDPGDSSGEVLSPKFDKGKLRKVSIGKLQQTSTEDAGDDRVRTWLSLSKESFDSTDSFSIKDANFQGMKVKRRIIQVDESNDTNSSGAEGGYDNPTQALLGQ